MNRLVQAILSDDAENLISLLRSTSALAVTPFERELLVEEVPHQVYVGDTPLHLAAAAIRFPAANLLLEAGAKVDAMNRNGAQPLHYACDLRPSHARWNPSEQERVMLLLLNHRADPDAPDKAGVRPLHRAVRARSPGAVRTLLDAGCSPKVRTGKSGSTPLHLAVGATGASGTAARTDLQVEIVQLLVNRGATWTDVDGEGKTAIDRITGHSLRRALSDAGLLPRR